MPSENSVALHSSSSSSVSVASARDLSASDHSGGSDEVDGTSAGEVCDFALQGNMAGGNGVHDGFDEGESGSNGTSHPKKGSLSRQSSFSESMSSGRQLLFSSTSTPIPPREEPLFASPRLKRRKDSSLVSDGSRHILEQNVSMDLSGGGVADVDDDDEDNNVAQQHESDEDTSTVDETDGPGNGQEANGTEQPARFSPGFFDTQFSLQSQGSSAVADGCFKERPIDTLHSHMKTAAKCYGSAPCLINVRNQAALLYGVSSSTFNPVYTHVGLSLQVCHWSQM